MPTSTPPRSSARVVGNAFGGALALHLAVAEPQRVGKLVLMGAVGAPFVITEALDGACGYEPSRRPCGNWVRWFAYDPSLASDDLVELRYQASVAPGVQTAYAAMFPHRASVTWTRSWSPTSGCVRCRTPRWWCTAATTTSSRSRRATTSRVPSTDSELHVFGRCGHWTQLERADAFHRLVLDFFGR